MFVYACKYIRSFFHYIYALGSVPSVKGTELVLVHIFVFVVNVVGVWKVDCKHVAEIPV